MPIPSRDAFCYHPAMSRHTTRPRFEIELSPHQADVLDRIGRRVSGEEPEPTVHAAGGTRGVRGRVHGDPAEPAVPPADARFFSPVLVLQRMEEHGRLLLKGRFSPHPHVWTLFMAVYGILALGCTGSLMFGISQWLIAEPPWALVGAPLALALAGFVYGAAVIGQGLSAEQMYVLRAVVDEALHELANPAASAPAPPTPAP